MKIDAHQHFWRYTVEDYGWIDDAMRVIRRDFLPGDLKQEIRAAGIDGVVSVQARQTLEETRWLLEMAAEHDFIKGVVGWVPLVEKNVREEISSLAAHPKLKAVRHVVQSEPDGFLTRGDFNAGVAALREFGLVYDVLILERQLAGAIQFVDRHPGQIFVLDHVAKPRIKDNAIEPWAANIRELARRPNMFCKVSGMVTEADFTRWSEAQLRPYFDTVLDAFGPAQLMFGSDWPVCLVASGYGQWLETVRHFIAELSATEQAQILGETAALAYGLK